MGLLEDKIHVLSQRPNTVYTLITKMLMPQLLDIKIMNLERRMRNIKLLTRFCRLKKERMVIRVFQPSVNMEEACDRFRVSVHDIRRRECDCGGIPVIFS